MEILIPVKVCSFYANKIPKLYIDNIDMQKNINPEIGNVQSISTNLLLYQLVITVGLTGIQGFLGHVFKSDMVAEYIG